MSHLKNTEKVEMDAKKHPFLLHKGIKGFTNSRFQCKLLKLYYST